ncbi:hypothetical protein I4F81_007487 [Pyropia yezoensis]|uniref:Uncharacterized protein n=1 Tax=Pyropia yezoensis TaxID=2788 RepID=A0ACC3C5B9_PYRYE|nr:hypothetical protein I4F81_007487 [Neopyropia yezoensis]
MFFISLGDPQLQCTPRERGGGGGPDGDDKRGAGVPSPPRAPRVGGLEPERRHPLNAAPERPGAPYTLLLLANSLRAHANAALGVAAETAARLDTPLLALTVVDAAAAGLAVRHHAWVTAGHEELAASLAARGVRLVVAVGPTVAVTAAAAAGAAALVTDWGYLREELAVRRAVGAAVGVAAVGVEANVVVPVAVASDHEEFAARTLRPKLMGALDSWLLPPPELPVAKASGMPPAAAAIDVAAWRTPDGRRVRVVDPSDWEATVASLDGVDRGAPPVSPAAVAEGAAPAPGEAAARATLCDFVDHRLEAYAERRNEPADSAQSGLSPYLRHGLLSPVDCVLAARGAAAAAPRGGSTALRSGVASFVEELVVRRELAVNLVTYCDRYDAVEGLASWARTTLADHAGDKRDVLYERAVLERGATADPYWNAAQRQMVLTGRMHGYMRMFWAKKILEWTPSPDVAFSIALALNNRWALDGADPNSVAGIAWAVGGKHDHGWAERPVFGKVRYMNEAGLRRKFRIDAYVAKVDALTQRVGGMPPGMADGEAPLGRGGGQAQLGVGGAGVAGIKRPRQAAAKKVETGDAEPAGTAAQGRGRLARLPAGAAVTGAAATGAKAATAAAVPRRRAARQATLGDVGVRGAARQPGASDGPPPPVARKKRKA